MQGGREGPRTEGEHVEGALPVALAARAPRVLEGALRLRGAVARLVPARILFQLNYTYQPEYIMSRQSSL